MKKSIKKQKVLKNNNTKIQLTGIDLLTSKAYKMKFQRYAERVSGIKLDFRMIPNIGCFTTTDKRKKAIMNIDLKMFENPSYGTSHYHIIAKGAILHESGHIRYSDYDVINQNILESEEAKKAVEDIAIRYHDAADADKPNIADELHDAVAVFVKAVNLPEFLNSLEDASVERSMSELGKDENGCICFMRDTIYNSEILTKQEGLNKNIIPIYDAHDWNDITLQFVLTEARHLATIGYRINVDTTIIDTIFEADEVQDIKDLSFHARYTAQTTADRNIASRALLDMCQPILDNITEKLTQKYINDLDAANDEANQMQNNANQFGQSSSGGSTGGLGGNGMPTNSQPQQQSKYDIKIPQNVQDRLNSASQEMGQGGSQNDGSSGAGTSSSDEDNHPNPMPTKKELSAEAINDKNEVIRNAKKTFESQEQHAQDNNILNHPDVRVGENECHHDVELNLRDYKDLISSMGKSYEGKDAKEYINRNNISSYVNDLSKKMKKILMHRSQDEISRGRFEGEIDTNNLYRINTDLQVFKRQSQGEKQHLRFALLVDESGSMCGSGLKNAIIGCWMVAKAAQKLKIPFAVYGHSEGCYSCRVNKYIDYVESQKKDSLEHLFNMESGGCNRDGLAIYHVCRELVKAAKPDEELYFIILSDGQPSGSGMSSEEGIADIQETINTFKRFGVHSIGIGLGDDFDYENTVGRIYENSVCVSKPSELPNEMFKVLKRMLKC